MAALVAGVALILVLIVSAFDVAEPAPVILGLTGAVAAVAWLLASRDAIREFRGAPEEEWRLASFAAANGMSFTRMTEDPDIPIMRIVGAHSPKASRRMRAETPRVLEFGDFEHTVGSGRSKMRLSYSYIAIRLNAPMPHILLDSTVNDKQAVWLGRYAKSTQRLSLEGDFDASFALYCPKGYERDALYLFTPDIMALFADNATRFDVEIVDDWMILVTRPSVIGTDPALWREWHSVVAAVTAKLAQWERWRDDRTDGPDVDPQGRRLER